MKGGVHSEVCSKLQQVGGRNLTTEEEKLDFIFENVWVGRCGHHKICF